MTWDTALAVLGDDDVAALVRPDGRIVLAEGDGCKWVTIRGNPVCITESPGHPRAEHTIAKMAPEVQTGVQQATKMYEAAKVTEVKRLTRQLEHPPKGSGIAMKPDQIDRITTAQAAKGVVYKAAIESKVVKTTYGKAIAETIPDRWVQSANHHESDLLKIAVADTFGGNVYDASQAKLLDNDDAIDDQAARIVNRLARYYGPVIGARGTKGADLGPDRVEQIRGDIKRLAQVQYAFTQQRLKALHVPEMVTLYRGVKIPGSSVWKKGQTVDLKLGSVSSFTEQSDTADSFGPVTVRVQVPRDRIFATYQTGLGDTAEREWIVLGGKGLTRATVKRVEDKSWFFTPEEDAQANALMRAAGIKTQA